jgi:hypothetical protein
MKKIFFLTSIFTILILSSLVSAQKAPDGIGGLKWGDSIEKFKELKDPTPWSLPEEGDRGKALGFRHIGLLGDVRTMSMGGYGFDKNRFSYFTVKIDPRDLTILKNALIMKYGDPTKESPLVLKINPNAKVGIEYQWILEDIVMIGLSSNEIKKEVVLSYFYLPYARGNIQEDKKSSERTKDSL